VDPETRTQTDKGQRVKVYPIKRPRLRRFLEASSTRTPNVGTIAACTSSFVIQQISRALSVAWGRHTTGRLATADQLDDSVGQVLDSSTEGSHKRTSDDRTLPRIVNRIQRDRRSIITVNSRIGERGEGRPGVDHRSRARVLHRRCDCYLPRVHGLWFVRLPPSGRSGAMPGVRLAGAARLSFVVS
jgi:hypothetical protein